MMKHSSRFAILILMAFSPLVAHAADHIVFIHGYQLTGRRADTWDRMVDFMTNPAHGTPFIASDKVLCVQHGNLDGSIDEVARNVWNQIQAGFPDGTSPSKMDFVVHSMGGLVLRSMVEQNLLPDSLVDRVVTLGTPHYGQRRGGTTQQRDMEYGSEFIWTLANTQRKISSRKILCVVGTEDGTVDEWSAALQDSECAAIRYVAKDHTAAGDWIGQNNALCYCAEGRNDVVYRLIVDFLSGGTVTTGNLSGTRNSGAILYQVQDAHGRPVSYNKKFLMNGIASVKRGDGLFTAAVDYSPAPASGIGAIVYHQGEVSPVLPPSGILPTEYILEFPESKDKVFSSFTSDPIPITRGRTTVIPIFAEDVKPLDYVFLIDTTGSMDSHIASVRSNAKNLISTKLLNGARDCRVAVVDYRDFPERTGDSRDYPYDVKCQFTENAVTAISAINSLTLGHGGDDEESVYSGIHACVVNNGAKIGGWRANSLKTIMVMCDAGPLDPEPVTGYTGADVVRWANSLKTSEDDDPVNIEYGSRSTASKSATETKGTSARGEGSNSAGGISIFSVVTSSSLASSFSGISEGTGGKVVSSTSYASVADAVEEVIEQCVAANGFEFESVTVEETAGSVTVRVYGGSSTDAASVGYQVVAGSAIAGKDYTAAAGEQRLLWSAGERSYKEIVIPVAEDAVSSLDKFFSIVLCNPVNMGLGGINVCRVNLTNVHSSEATKPGDVYVQGVSRQVAMGTVEGSGYYNLGSTATLTATANAGFVFTSWENGDTSPIRNIDVTLAASNAVDGVATYVASFCPLEDLPLPTIFETGSVTGYVGQAFFWNLSYYSQSEATVSYSGLPSGLSCSNGVVQGMVASIGEWPVTFHVSNAKGETSATIRFCFCLLRGEGDLYVDAAMGDDDNDGLSWQTAKASIQAAIDAADDGYLIMVNDGVYEPITTVTYSWETRQSIGKSLEIVSVNGAEKTIIDGALVLDSNKAVRVAYLGTDDSGVIGWNAEKPEEPYAVLEGFTLRGGRPSSGGSSYIGTGAMGGVLRRCIVSDNCSAGAAGGGVAYAICESCTIAGNKSTKWIAGGAYNCTLLDCTIENNEAANSGGGTIACWMKRCIIRNNRSGGYGGAQLYGLAEDSLIEGNDAKLGGGAVAGGYLSRCTVVNNHADGTGGGAFDTVLHSSIVWNNTAGEADGNCDVCYGSYNDTTPLLSGLGNISADPCFRDTGSGDYRLSPSSPCIDAGFGPSDISQKDLLGEVRWQGIRIDMGAFETSNSFAPSFIANNLWVDAEKGNDANSGESREDALATIRAAVEKALDGATIHVLPGTYAPLTLEGRILTLQSTDGPEKTIIDGRGVSQCAWLGHTISSILEGFTLSNGYVPKGGGGVYGGTLRGCILLNNKAELGGGGAFHARLERCVLQGNMALNRSGGGASCCDLVNCLVYGNSACTIGGGVAIEENYVENCTIVGNTATEAGGGVAGVGGYVRNSIVWGNSAPTSPDLDGCDEWHVCSSVVKSDCGSITNDPHFVDAESGNFKLRMDSPCINAGANDYVQGDTDLAGNARIFGSAVDIGAYEQIEGVIAQLKPQAAVNQRTYSLRLGVAAGSRYEIQWTAALDGEWKTLKSWTGEKDGETEVEVSVPEGSGMGFFRLVMSGGKSKN